VDTAAIITAASVLFGAVVTGVIAIIREVRSVHKIVNQQRSDMLDEIKALKRFIRSEGGDPNDAT
jgi:hypothetical protein